MGADTILTAAGLKKSYSGRPVLEQLDFQVERGAAIGLLGANGVGKTTLMRALLGLVPVDAGECTVFGESSRALSPAARARIAYVPQRADQFAWLTGRAMLKYVAEFYPSFDREYVDDLAGRWKLTLHSEIGTLSPGQQQRLAIVRALATRPDLLLLDEPIASLDPATRIAVIDELVQLRARRALTLVFSSHLIGDLERLCTRFTILANHRVALDLDVARFRDLVRVRIEGPEAELAAMSVEWAPLWRVSGPGERIAVVAPADAARIVAVLPAGVSARVEATDIENIASEWMR